MLLVIPGVMSVDGWQERVLLSGCHGYHGYRDGWGLGPTKQGSLAGVLYTYLSL